MSSQEGGWISINDWDEFQHVDVKRGSGPPPWIKTYTRLMHDDDYLELTEHCALVLHRLWLTYASARCHLRLNTLSLSRRLGLRVMTRDIDRLVQAGFITIVASKALAEGVQDAGTTRARVEVEEEVEEVLDRSSRSEITSEPRPDLTESEDPHKGEDEQPFAREPEPELPNNNGAGYDLPTIEQRPNLEPDDSMERLGDVSELVERWSGESA